MKEITKTKKNELLVFENENDLEMYFSELVEKLKKEMPEKKNVDSDLTYDNVIDNSQGTSIKQWIGTRMEQRGDPKIYVDVTIGPVHPRDQAIHKDIRSLNLMVYKCSFYYQWWNGQQWIYVQNTLPSEAPAGKYFPVVGIRWVPQNNAEALKSENILSINSTAKVF